MLSGDPTTLATGLSVGDKLTFRARTDSVVPQTIEFTLEIAGFINRPLGKTSPIGAPNYAPRGAFPPDIAHSVEVFVLNVDTHTTAQLRSALSGTFGSMVVETTRFNEITSGILRQYSTFPAFLALLTLIIGSIVIANSVALLCSNASARLLRSRRLACRGCAFCDFADRERLYGDRRRAGGYLAEPDFVNRDCLKLFWGCDHPNHSSKHGPGLVVAYLWIIRWDGVVKCLAQFKSIAWGSATV